MIINYNFRRLIVSKIAYNWLVNSLGPDKTVFQAEIVAGVLILKDNLWRNPKRKLICIFYNNRAAMKVLNSIKVFKTCTETFANS